MLDDVEEHLARAAAAARPFEVHLRGTGTFRPVSPVVFVALAAGISGCEALRPRCAPARWRATLEFPYHPHVTVAHDLPTTCSTTPTPLSRTTPPGSTSTEFVLYTHGASGWTRAGVRPHRLTGASAARAASGRA